MQGNRLRVFTDPDEVTVDYTLLHTVSPSISPFSVVKIIQHQFYRVKVFIFSLYWYTCTTTLGRVSRLTRVRSLPGLRSIRRTVSTYKDNSPPTTSLLRPLPFHYLDFSEHLTSYYLLNSLSSKTVQTFASFDTLIFNHQSPLLRPQPKRPLYRDSYRYYHTLTLYLLLFQDHQFLNKFPNTQIPHPPRQKCDDISYRL